MSEFISVFLCQIKLIKWTMKLDIPLRDYVEIDGGGIDGSVAQETADRVEINPLVQQVGCEAVSEGVDAADAGYAGFFFAL